MRLETSLIYKIQDMVLKRECLKRILYKNVVISKELPRNKDIRNEIVWVLRMQMSPYLKWDDLRG